MLWITPKAYEKLENAINQEEVKPFGVRLGIKGGGCQGYQYVIDFIKDETEIDKEEDTICHLNQIKIIIDIFSAQYLDETTLDYVDSLNESGFKFNNASAKRTCGCGSSFSV